ncbi:hypothetical protein ACFQVD_26805 [Streptosporangium amethystogenes subsp. fukuiense]|uniref:ATPase n=1 Tax=Streptosporangium amethystogenes subsp. fukuiense TaxID=698418 RepID=A0ABW2T7N8_9ACTN
MAETPGLDALDAGFRAELGPPVEELNALNIPPERLPVKDLLWAATWLQGEVKRLRCTDPVECGHEAALGQAQAEVGRLTAALAESRRDTHCARTDYALARARTDKAETERDKLGVELATAKAVMYRALKEVEHEEVLYLIRRYLDVYPGTTTAFPTTTGEGEA